MTDSPEETFDISMTASSTTENGRSYLAEQQRVPFDLTPMALATVLRAVMGQMHPDGAIMIDTPTIPRPSQAAPDQVEVPGANVHEQIVDALTLVNAWRERDDVEYATLSMPQISQLAEALDAADTLAHVVHEHGGGAVARVRQQARVLLGEHDGSSVFREAKLATDSDRPDGSLLVTLDPLLTENESMIIRSGQADRLRSAADDSRRLTELLRLLLRFADGKCFCGVCNAVYSEGGAPLADIAAWMLSHLEEGRCWEPIQSFEAVNDYVPVTAVRPGDEIRIEFQQDDGTFVNNPTENGDELDHGYVTDTVILLDTGEHVLGDVDRTRLQMRDEPENSIHHGRMRRIFMIKRGEWSSALRETHGLRADRANHASELRHALGMPYDSSRAALMEAIRTLRMHASNRKIYLSQIAVALGLPEIAVPTPVATEVETVRAILGRLRMTEPDRLRKVVSEQMLRPGMPVALQQLPLHEAIVSATDMLIAALTPIDTEGTPAGE